MVDRSAQLVGGTLGGRVASIWRGRRCRTTHLSSAYWVGLLLVQASLLLLAGWRLTSPAVAASSERYTIDTGTAAIEFSVHHLHFFTYHGEFRRFWGYLSLDWRDLRTSQINIVIDATSVDMESPYALALLRSPQFFDIDRFPRIRFASTVLTSVAPNRYLIQGMLHIRGIVRPETLSVQVASQSLRKQGGSLDIVARGKVSRAAFGMTADEVYISDEVDLLIKAHLPSPKSRR